jgi:hypothetical protein
MDIYHEITFDMSPKNQIEIFHFWITLNKNGTILDPSIQLFKSNETNVFLGKIWTYLKTSCFGLSNFRSKSFILKANYPSDQTIFGINHEINKYAHQIIALKMDQYHKKQ